MFIVKIMLANNQNDPLYQHLVLFGNINKYVYIKQFVNNKKMNLFFASSAVVQVLNPFSDRNVFIRQILIYKGGPRTEKFTIFLMAVYP